jgi:dolichyl-phosphate beta-glucosyltransferase
VLGLGMYDTQCGFKLFRAELIRPHLSKLQEQGWMLDVELLALARAASARILEEPIDWADPGGSKMTPGIDAIRMLRDLMRVSARIRRWSAIIPVGTTSLSPSDPSSTGAR